MVTEVGGDPCTVPAGPGAALPAGPMLRLRALDGGGAWRDLAGPYGPAVAVWLLGVLAPRYGRDRIALVAA